MPVILFVWFTVLHPVIRQVPSTRKYLNVGVVNKLITPCAYSFCGHYAVLASELNVQFLLLPKEPDFASSQCRQHLGQNVSSLRELFLSDLSFILLRNRHWMNKGMNGSLKWKRTTHINVFINKSQRHCRTSQLLCCYKKPFFSAIILGCFNS